MQEAVKNLLLVLVTLFPIVDPLGGSPFFLALTREYSPEARKALSWRIAVNSCFLLVATYFVGTYVLAFFGISLPAVRPMENGIMKMVFRFWNVAIFFVVQHR